jgi:hypothetical protein
MYVMATGMPTVYTKHAITASAVKPRCLPDDSTKSTCTAYDCHVRQHSVSGITTTLTYTKQTQRCAACTIVTRLRSQKHVVTTLQVKAKLITHLGMLIQQSASSAVAVALTSVAVDAEIS